MSVEEAVQGGFKTDVNGCAQEARTLRLARHSLLNGICDVVATAEGAGFARTRPVGETVVRKRTRAAAYIIGEVLRGVEVKLVYAHDLYLHSGGRFFARMRPDSILLTLTVDQSLVYAFGERVWTRSVHPTHGALLEKFPICFRGKGAWKLPVSSPLWPVYASEGACGCTGMSQLCKITCVWVEGGAGAGFPDHREGEQNAFWADIESEEEEEEEKQDVREEAVVRRKSARLMRQSGVGGSSVWPSLS